MDRDATAQPAGLADHALPRQAIGGRAGFQRRGGDARTAGQPGELGDLAVGRDAAAWDAADHGVHRVVEALQMRSVVVVIGLFARAAGRHLAGHGTTEA